MIKNHKTATSIAALSLCLSANAAFADLSAQDVWEDWKGYMSSFGYALDGTENMSGDTLTVTDLNMAMQLPDDAGDMKMTISEFSFTNNGDGTVTMTIPPVMPLTLSVNSPDAEDVDMTVDYVTSAFSMVASGDPTNLTYTYAAEELSLILKEMMVEGEALDIGNASMAMANLVGSSVIRNGNLRNIAQTIATGPVTYVMDFADPEGEGRVVINGSLDSMSFQGDGAYPSNMDTTDMSAMLKAGFGFDGGFTHQGSKFNFNFQEEGETVQVTSSSESGALGVAMDASKLMYDVSSNNLNIQMAGGEIPFPVEVAMAQSGFKLLMPVAKDDAEQDFALGVTMGDFTMSDLIWGIFDPAGQLPRDPATIAMDLSGKAKLFLDILDPEQMEAMDSGDAVPGELNSVSLNTLTIRAAGAELTGNGAFTFDNSDLQTFGGMPAPDGSVDLKLTGGNGLLDKLVAMGILPEDQAMGARMMMGLFAVAGEGEDTLNSKIEVTSDGQVLANGQRLK